MNKALVLLSAVLCMTSVTSCAEVPDEVMQDMSSYIDEEKDSSEQSELEYITISELAENAEIALGKEYTQFELSDKIRFSAPEEIYLMSFRSTEGFSDNFDKVMELFFDNSVISSQTLSISDDEDDRTVSFMSDEDKVYGCVGDDGFIAMLNPDAYDISFGYQEPNVGIYHTERNDDFSDEYQLKDRKCSVAEAVEFVDNWFETNFRPFSPEFDYKAETVIVREHEGNYLYQISVHAVYKGVPLDSYTREHEKDEETNTIRGTYSDYCIQLQMIKSDEIASFTNGTGIYIPTECEKIDECISLESALRLCEDTFADFKDITVSDIGIMYTLNPVYEANPNADEDPLNKEIVVGYSSRPVWELVIDVPPSEFIKEGEANTYGDLRKYIYVDMITGELKYNFDPVIR